MARIVAVANQKGGVAKTTTVASLGAAFAESGLRVLLVDLDSQACLTFSLGVEEDDLDVALADALSEQAPIDKALVNVAERIDLLPGSIDLADAEAYLVTRGVARERVLRDLLREQAGDYDVVLIDCSPSLGLLTLSALTAADEVIIPLQCEMLAHRGVGQLLDTVADVQRLANPDLSVRGVLPTMFDGRTAHSRAVLADISERYGVTVLEPPIPRTVRFAEAPAEGATILDTASGSAGAAAYREVAAGLRKAWKLRARRRPAAAKH